MHAYLPSLEPNRYSILKQRLARRLQHEGVDASKLDLVSVTKGAERTITSVSGSPSILQHPALAPLLELLPSAIVALSSRCTALPPKSPSVQDLEFLIEKAVDPKKADYAVFTGVQVGSKRVKLRPNDTYG